MTLGDIVFIEPGGSWTVLSNSGLLQRIGRSDAAGGTRSSALVAYCSTVTDGAVNGR